MSSLFLISTFVSGAGKVSLNTSEASPAPERYQISIYIETLLRRRRSLGSILKTPFRGRISIHTHGEVLIYTYLAPERPEKPEKYLYTANSTDAL